METGQVIREDTIITRAAEGEITFFSGASYVPVIQGTSPTQVKQATAGATNVVGFAKKDMRGDVINDHDAVSVVVAPALIQIPVDESVNVNDYLVVGEVPTQLSKTTVDSSGNVGTTLMAAVVARSKQTKDSSGNIYVSLGV